MNDVLEILEKLEAEPSRLGKTAIMNEHKDFPGFREACFAAYSQYLTYNVKKIPDYLPSVYQDLDLVTAIASLIKLHSREVTGNAALRWLSDVLSRLNPRDAIVLERIISRDLRCGIGIPTIKEVFPSFATIPGVMLAYKDTSGIKYPCIGQIKYDGTFATMKILDDDTTFSYGMTTRQGKPMYTLGVFNKFVQDINLPYGVEISGELLYCVDGVFQPRRIVNGMVNKAVKGTITEDEAANFVFAVWDIIYPTFDNSYWNTPYEQRLETLETHFPQQTVNVILAESRRLENESKAKQWFEEALADGAEGLVLKNYGSPWVPKRTKNLGKMKKSGTADLVVVELIEGTGQFEGMLGSATVITRDGKVSANVGSGFTPEERKNFFTPDFIGSILEVEYMEVSESKDGNTLSLTHPRFIEVRSDKTDADSYDELVTKNT